MATVSLILMYGLFPEDCPVDPDPLLLFPPQNVNPMLGGNSVAQGRGPQLPPQTNLRNQVPPPILPSQVTLPCSQPTPSFSIGAETSSSLQVWKEEEVQKKSQLLLESLFLKCDWL